MKRFIGTIATGLCLLLVGLVAQAGAHPPDPVPAPEIDPGIASGAIGLLTCGVLMLTAKWRKK
jgi:hypothetical protein